MTPSRLLALPASVLLALPLAACGGGGGGDDDAKNVVLPVVSEFTGTMASFGPYSEGLTDGILVVGDEYYAGDDYEDRCFLSFDLSAIPVGAIIEKAELHLAGRIHTATNPYLSMGSLLVDQVEMGAAVSLNDFLDTHVAGVAVLPTFTSDPTYQEGVVDLTLPVSFDYANASPRTSYRLRFNTAPYADDATARIAIVCSGVDPSARPMLVVTLK